MQAKGILTKPAIDEAVHTLQERTFMRCSTCLQLLLTDCDILSCLSVWELSLPQPPPRTKETHSLDSPHAAMSLHFCLSSGVYKTFLDP